jgi:hypothetical protein
VHQKGGNNRMRKEFIIKQQGNGMPSFAGMTAFLAAHYIYKFLFACSAKGMKYNCDTNIGCNIFNAIKKPSAVLKIEQSLNAKSRHAREGGYPIFFVFLENNGLQALQNMVIA